MQVRILGDDRIGSSLYRKPSSMETLFVCAWAVLGDDATTLASVHKYRGLTVLQQIWCCWSKWKHGTRHGYPVDIYIISKNALQYTSMRPNETLHGCIYLAYSLFASACSGSQPLGADVLRPSNSKQRHQWVKHLCIFDPLAVMFFYQYDSLWDFKCLLSLLGYVHVWLWTNINMA